MTPHPNTDELRGLKPLSANAAAILDGVLFCKFQVHPADHQEDDEHVLLAGFSIPKHTMSGSAVLDALREIKEAAISRARAIPADGKEEILDAVKMRLREHWLTGIHCDHERKTDRASCSCTIWRGEEKPNIAAAVQDWIEHAQFYSPPSAALVTNAMVERALDELDKQTMLIRLAPMVSKC